MTHTHLYLTVLQLTGTCLTKQQEKMIAQAVNMDVIGRAADRVDRILLATCDEFGVSVEQVVNGSRKHPLPDARHTFAYIARKATGARVKDIGRRMNKDHASALHGIKKIADLLTYDREMAAHIARIQAAI